MYSSGFLNLVDELFGGRPERSRLLERVWGGYSALLETAEVGGKDGVGHKSVMASQQRTYAELAGAMAEAATVQVHARSELEAALTASDQVSNVSAMRRPC